jgi:peptidoglycan-N-acetylmuramic acid deacetylase
VINLFENESPIKTGAPRQKGWKYAYRKVMSQLHPGAVILLHSVSKDNAEALDEIIDDARKQGYEFKDLKQLTVKNY